MVFFRAARGARWVAQRASSSIPTRFGQACVPLLSPGAPVPLRQTRRPPRRRGAAAVSCPD
jgi:hypothetical protein